MAVDEMNRSWRYCGWKSFSAVLVVVVAFLLNYGCLLTRRNQISINTDFGLLSVNDINEFLRQDQPDRSQRRYLVLIWRRPWGMPFEGPPEGARFGECVMTYNRTFLPQSQAVVFHHSAFYGQPRPQYRNQSQIFVWFSMESAWYIRYLDHDDLSQYENGFFNWTMNYRRDADVFNPYVSKVIFSKLMYEGRNRIDETIAKKYNVALWVTSNCNLTKGSRMRMKYVEELIAAGLSVDLYGRCFNNIQEYERMPLPQMASYKFYLSFENAQHCRDYVTEKFWYNSLYSARVPVVWGPTKEDLDSLVPPKSYIFAEDFDSPASLASYLQYLNTNDTAYKEYFQWLQHPESLPVLLQNLSPHFMATLCQKLRANTETKMIGNLSKHFYGTEREECLSLS